MVLHTRGRVGRRHFTDWRVSEAGLRKPSFFCVFAPEQPAALRQGSARFPGFVPALFFGMGVLLQLRQNCLSCVCFRQQPSVCT